MQPDVRSRYDFWFYTVVQRDTCIACMLILAFNFQASTASEFADHTLGGHVTPHNPIRIQCQVHGKVFQFQVFYQSKTTSATGKVSLPAEKLASSSHLMMNHLLERFPTCQVMCFHPLPQPPMDAVLEATENNKWRDGCQSYRKSGIFYHLGFWIGFFLLYYLCYLYRGVTVSITTYISLNLYIYIRTQVMGNGLVTPPKWWISLFGLRRNHLLPACLSQPFSRWFSGFFVRGQWKLQMAMEYFVWGIIHGIFMHGRCFWRVAYWLKGISMTSWAATAAVLEVPLVNGTSFRFSG